MYIKILLPRMSVSERKVRVVVVEEEIYNQSENKKKSFRVREIQIHCTSTSSCSRRENKKKKGLLPHVSPFYRRL